MTTKEKLEALEEENRNLREVVKRNAENAQREKERNSWLIKKVGLFIVGPNLRDSFKNAYSEMVRAKDHQPGYFRFFISKPGQTIDKNRNLYILYRYTTNIPPVLPE